MNNTIKVGLGIMLKDKNRVLLGHRAKTGEDTGGIYEPDSWTFPGGKQEYNESILEGAIREVKEETNLNISDLEIFNVVDDIQPDRHYITIQLIAHQYTGDLKIMEPTKEDKWEWHDLDKLPENLYTPTQKFIEQYLKSQSNKT